MTEYAYDPDFPYLVVEGYVIAKFPAGERGRDDAQSVAEGYGWDFIDTTPKPKIPEDAEYIYWRDEDEQPYFARKDEIEWLRMPE